MDGIKEQTISGIKWSAIERFSVQGIQFLLGLMIARLLSPSDYGIIGMLGIFFAISQTFIDSGFSNALIRKIDRTDVDFSTVFYFNIVVGFVCSVIIFLSAPCISDFFNQPILTDVTRVLSINVLLGSLTTVQYAKLTIDIDFKTQAKVSLISTLVSGCIGVYLAWKGYGVWALVYQSVAASVLRVLLLWIRVKWTPLWTYSWESFHTLFSFGSKLLLSGLLHTLYTEMTTIAIGKFYTPKELGNYSRGQSIATLPCANITAILQRVTFPIFSRIQDDDKHLISIYRKYIILSSMVIFFVMTLLVFLAKPLVLFLLTDKWINAVIFLQIYSFAIMFDHICQINLNLLQVKGRSDLFLKLEIVKKSISMMILFASIPLGVLFICISKVIYTQIAVFLNTYYTGKLFYLGYWQQMRDFMPYLLLSVIACSGVYGLSLVIENNLVLLIVGTLLSTAIYVSLLYLKQDKIFMEFAYPVIKRLLKK